EKRIIDNIVKRFDSETVTRRKDCLRHSIVDGEGPHAIETGKACGTPCGVGLENHFRVRAGSKIKSQFHERQLQVPEVIDFAVDGYDVPPVWRNHRLMS